MVRTVQSRARQLDLWIPSRSEAHLGHIWGLPEWKGFPFWESWRREEDLHQGQRVRETLSEGIAF